MNKSKILLIEDDVNLGFIIQENLELQGFYVELCSDGEEGYKTFLSKNFDLCLIDVMLPKKDGFTVAQEIRKIDQEIPIIFLTAKSLKEDRIHGFKIGADDYITKPFSTEELVLRIQAVLRRSKKVTSTDSDQNIFKIGTYQFDYNKQTLQINQSEQKLTHKEAELLRLLCLHKNHILDRNVALNLIWKDNSFYNSRSMDVYISKLRKYLSKDEQIEILNVHGKGFKLAIYSKPQKY